MLASVALVLTACSKPSSLETVRQQGALHFMATNSPSVYFEGRDGPTGLEYELAKRFADELGVELRVRVADSQAEMFSVLDRGYTHLGAAGIALNDERQTRYQVVNTHLEVQSIVIFHRSADRPRELTDLLAQPPHIVGSSNHSYWLEQLQQSHPELRWVEHANLDTAGLLERVESGEFPVAVIDSTELALNHVYYPNVLRAFELSEPTPIVWLLPANLDDSIASAAEAFFERASEDGSLAQLHERFYGHLDRLNYVGARTFVHHVRHRLPTYEQWFQDYAEEYGLDWRLLAAIGYQESHWRPNAVSPTGVRGLMMLTRNTAAYIGINNRLDPEQSIKGGARYFTMVHRKIPERIPEPDRTWFALASYNVGFGHLEDARRLTEMGGRDPDRWMDVKDFLPLLAQKEWYTRTRFGYARGHEPVVYVQNIRRYYDVLAWMKEPSADADTFAHFDRFDALPDDDQLALPLDETDTVIQRGGLPRALSQTPPTL